MCLSCIGVVEVESWAYAEDIKKDTGDSQLLKECVWNISTTTSGPKKWCNLPVASSWPRKSFVEDDNLEPLSQDMPPGNSTESVGDPLSFPLLALQNGMLRWSPSLWRGLHNYRKRWKSHGNSKSRKNDPHKYWIFTNKTLEMWSLQTDYVHMAFPFFPCCFQRLKNRLSNHFYHIVRCEHRGYFTKLPCHVIWHSKSQQKVVLQPPHHLKGMDNQIVSWAMLRAVFTSLVATRKWHLISFNRN